MFGIKNTYMQLLSWIDLDWMHNKKRGKRPLQGWPSLFWDGGSDPCLHVSIDISQQTRYALNTLVASPLCSQHWSQRCCLGCGDSVPRSAEPSGGFWGTLGRGWRWLIDLHVRWWGTYHSHKELGFNKGKVGFWATHLWNLGQTINRWSDKFVGIELAKVGM